MIHEIEWVNLKLTLAPIVLETMEDAQVERIVNAVTTAGAQSGKVDTLESLLPEDWMNWRVNFVLTVEIKGWDNQRARRECARSMKGKAKSVTSHIPLGVPAAAGQQIEPVANMLDEYEAVFVPAAATDAARNKVRGLRQEEGEGVLEWRTRLQLHFLRANPHMDAAARAASQDLKDLFIRGLSSAETRKGVCWGRPATVQEAYDAATSIDSYHELYGADAPGRRSMNHMGSMETQSNQGSNQQASGGRRVASFETRSCYNCNKQGHLARNCRSRGGKARGGKSNRGNRNRSGQWRGAKSSRGNSYSWRKSGGRGGGNGGAAIGAMEDGEKAEGDSADYTEAYGATEGEEESQGFHQD